MTRDARDGDDFTPAERKAAWAGALALHPDDQAAAQLLWGILLFWGRMTPWKRLSTWQALVLEAPAQRTVAARTTAGKAGAPPGWRVVKGGGR